MEITKKYKETLRVCVVGALLATINFIFQMRENNLIILCISFVILGGFAIPIVAIVCECSAECTYPASEDLGNGILMVGGSLLALIFTLIWGGFLPTTGHYYDSISNPSTYFIIGVFAMVSFALFLFNGEYKRLKLEAIQSQSYIDISSNKLNKSNKSSQSNQLNKPNNNSSNSLDSDSQKQGFVY